MVIPAPRKVHAYGAGLLCLSGVGCLVNSWRGRVSMADGQVGHCCFGSHTSMEKRHRCFWFGSDSRVLVLTLC